MVRQEVHGPEFGASKCATKTRRSFWQARQIDPFKLRMKASLRGCCRLWLQWSLPLGGQLHGDFDAKARDRTAIRSTAKFLAPPLIVFWGDGKGNRLW